MKPTRLLAAFLLLALAATAVRAQPLSPRELRDLVEKARAYFDPEQEFLWRVRKEFLGALEMASERRGVESLADIPFMREVAYQGRHFGIGFDERDWQREVGADYEKSQGIYQNVKSEQWRFTYTTPRLYPKSRNLAKVPREDPPYPLLVVLHEFEDTKDARGAVDHPGEAVMERLYPKSDYDDLYDDLHESWLTLAPVAARGRFLDDEGRVRHSFLTLVLTEFWRRYHVDFDRIVLDGSDSAMALAAVFPHVFAGLVVRGGEVKPELVKNYASVPVFVVRDEATKNALEDAGHPDVTLGSAKDAVVWLNQRKRIVPASFEWRMLNDDHRYANWMTLLLGDPERTLKVRTDRAENRITIQSEGVQRLQLFLNDEIVDLDRDVTLVWNGEERVYADLERDVGQMFDKDPYVRRNMNFGWLYPVMLDDLGASVGPSAVEVEEEPRGPGDGTGESEAEAKAKRYFEGGLAAEADGNEVKAEVYYRLAVDVGETSYRARAEEHLAILLGYAPASTSTRPRETPEARPDRVPAAPASTLDDEARLAVQQLFLLGQLDRIDELIGDSEHAADLFPLALRDLWWRHGVDEERRAFYDRAGATAEGLMGEQWRWLLEGGRGPYPGGGAQDLEPWPVLTALVQDRQLRETVGRGPLPEASPLWTMTPPEAWRDWWPEWKAYVLDDVMRTSYHASGRDRMSADAQAAEDEADRIAARQRTTNLLLALVAGVLFIGAVLLGGRRLRAD